MKKYLIPLAVLTIFTSFLLADAAATRPITFDDFIRLQRVSDPQISPDGKCIACVITKMDKEANKGNSDIWLVPISGGEMRRLTSSLHADFNPRWSPCGKKIAFISTRSGTPQIWMIDPTGGEATQLTHISTGASGVAWSPDGKYLAYISAVYPDCPDDNSNRKKAEAQKKSNVKAVIFTELLFRHWNEWRDGTRSHLFIMPATGGKPVDLTPGNFDTPPIALGGYKDYVFSPDGKEIAFVRNIDPEFKLGLGTNNDLFVTPTGGAEIKPVTTNRANDNSPCYSPDGRYIAFKAMDRPGFEADKYSLVLFDRRAQTIRNLTEKLDYSVEEILWSPDNKAIYFNAEEKGRTALFRISLGEAKIEKILDGHTFSALRLLPDGKKIIFLKQAMNLPSEIYGFDLETKDLTPLTGVNQALLSQIEMNPAEEFWFEGAAGDKVHGWLLKPPFFDASKKYPLVMLIHGGPQGAWNDDFHYRWNAQMFASPGYVVAMINFHGSTGYGQKFTDSISGDWGGKPYLDIMQGLGYLHDRYDFIDMDRNAAAGASYGGYMINWIEGHANIFRCLVSHDGVFDLRSMYGGTEELWFPEWDLRGTPWTSPEQYTKWSPSSYVKNFKTPCLVIHGQNDFRVPLEQGLQLFTSLQRMKVPSKFLYFPDEDHFVQKPRNAELWWKTVLEWIETYLKK
ncbi:MAG: S9 family peptidase [Candidatus Aminicenantales bacterium]